VDSFVSKQHFLTAVNLEPVVKNLLPVASDWELSRFREIARKLSLPQESGKERKGSNGREKKPVKNKDVYCIS